MEIDCWFNVLFILIFIIYLFIYSKRCQQKQVEPTTCFYLLMEIDCWFNVLFILIFIIYLFIYLFKVMSTKAGGTDHLFLFIFLWIREIPFVIFYGRIDFYKYIPTPLWW